MVNEIYNLDDTLDYQGNSIGFSGGYALGWGPSVSYSVGAQAEGAAYSWGIGLQAGLGISASHNDTEYIPLVSFGGSEDTVYHVDQYLLHDSTGFFTAWLPALVEILTELCE